MMVFGKKRLNSFFEAIQRLQNAVQQLQDFTGPAVAFCSCWTGEVLH